MRILGVDPGIARIGWSVIDEEQLIDYGLWSPKSDYKPMHENLDERLQKLYIEAKSVIQKYDVTHLVLETPPSFGDMSSKTKTTSVAVLIKCLAFECNLQWKQLQPRTVKKYGTGNSKASKLDVQEAVRKIYVEQEITVKGPAADVFDAIMIATVGKSRGRWWPAITEVGASE
jgi:crossover junction endodeoxyribonuclease RuvC